MPAEIVDINAAARTLNRTTRHVRALCSAGRIDSARNIGGSWVILAQVDKKGKLAIPISPVAKAGE